MIEILRKTSKLTIIMWTFLAEDYFIQMSIHKFSKHLLLWVSLVCTVSRLAWEAACLLISQMADWARLGPHEARARRPDISNTETLAEIRGELLEYGTAAETRKSIFLRRDGWFLRPDGGNICEKVMERYSVGYACLRPSYYFDILFKIIPEFQKFMYDLSWKPWIDSSLDFQYMGSMVAVHLIFRSPDLENKFLSTLILRNMTHILMLGSAINNVNKF